MKSQSKTYQMVKVGVMTAVICVLSPLSVPIGEVPISLSFFAIFLSLFVLGTKLGTLSCFLYILIGCVGIPVFSNFSGGVGKLLGPTGGYIVGYLFLAVIAGVSIDIFMKKARLAIWVRYMLCFCGMALASAVCYAFGTAWYCFQSGNTLEAALAICVIPFIPWDIVKIVIALAVGPQIRKRLVKYA